MKNKALVFLSGEGTTIPLAEAKALFLAYDPSATFESPEPRVLIADSVADPLRVGSRIAFARRVGHLVDEGVEAASVLRGRRVRFRDHDLRGKGGEVDPGRYLQGLDATIDLLNPEYELTLVRGEQDYLAVTSPSAMNQGWSTRRPRVRPFFHPSAIFPKLSRALVNLLRCMEGGVFLDPFSGTGSIPLEAWLVGAKVVAADQTERMVRGALQNMKHFAQDWLGVVRADATCSPTRRVDAVATDIPYGRASSTRGRAPAEVVDDVLPKLAGVMSKGSFIALMHPQSLQVSGSRELSVLEEHHLYVHKLLTRTITVLERR